MAIEVIIEERYKKQNLEKQEGVIIEMICIHFASNFNNHNRITDRLTELMTKQRGKLTGKRPVENERT